MKFAEKLKKAMQELNLNQRQVVTLTGKSKGSVSQYLSGKQIPSEDVQSAIATSLGLASDYFTGMDQELQVMPQLEIRDGDIPRLAIPKAAKQMGMNPPPARPGPITQSEKVYSREFFPGDMQYIPLTPDGPILSMLRDLQKLRGLPYEQNERV